MLYFIMKCPFYLKLRYLMIIMIFLDLFSLKKIYNMYILTGLFLVFLNLKLQYELNYYENITYTNYKNYLSTLIFYTNS